MSDGFPTAIKSPDVFPVGISRSSDIVRLMIGFQESARGRDRERRADGTWGLCSRSGPISSPRQSLSRTALYLIPPFTVNTNARAPFFKLFACGLFLHSG